MGQSLTPTSAWPRLKITSYSWTIDYPTVFEELTRTQEDPPAKGGGAPFAGEQKQVNLVSGKYAWNQPGAQPQPALAAADERQMQILAHAAWLHQRRAANNITEKKKGGTEVSYSLTASSKVSGVIDSQGLVVRTETWIPIRCWATCSSRAITPITKTSVASNSPLTSSRNRAATWCSIWLNNVQVNVANAALTPRPRPCATTAPPVRVESQKLADGVWFMNGRTHNSVLVEYKDYLTVVEAPNSEERSLAVIAEAKKLVPNKPIKYLINTHHHFDHQAASGLMLPSGQSLCQRRQQSLHEQARKRRARENPDKLAQSPEKASFIEVKDKYVLTDGTRSLELHLTEDDTHNITILFGYLPKEKILIEADDFTRRIERTRAGAALALGLGNNLYDNITRLKLDITTIAPLRTRGTLHRLHQSAGQRLTL